MPDPLSTLADVVVDGPMWASRRQQPTTSGEQWLFDICVGAAEALGRQGLVITAANLHGQDSRITLARAAEVVASGRFADACEARGIPLSTRYGLTPEQSAAVAIYMDTSVTMSHAQKLRAAGVSEQKWRGWMRQQAFSDAMARTAENIISDSAPLAFMRIHDVLDKGANRDALKAAELVLEITGRHDRRQQSLDVGAILTAVFQILDEEGVDPAILASAGARIRTLTAGTITPTVQTTSRPADALEG